MTATKSARTVNGWGVAAVTGVSALHILSALREPIGSVLDEATYLLLARSLSHGAFASPDAAGIPVTDPLPGFSLLLALPVRLAEPHWLSLRILGLAATGIVIAWTWRLAQRFFSAARAGAVTLLVALNPALLGGAGLLTPDIPFLALSLLLFDGLARAKEKPGALWTAGLALACLMRPHGILLAASLLLAVAWRSPRWALGLGLASLAPWAAWLMRNRLVSGSPTGYAEHWKSDTLAFEDPARQFLHAQRLLASLFGDGLLGLGDFPAAIALAAGLAALVIAGRGALALIREKEEPWIMALAGYCALTLCLHLTWSPISPRYLIPLLPALWIFLLAGAAPTKTRLPRWLLACAAAVALLALRRDLGMAEAGWRDPAPVLQPKTMAWIRERTPHEARFESLFPAALTLLTDRPAYLPNPKSSTRSAWETDLLQSGARYVLIQLGPIARDGFLPPGAVEIIQRHPEWAASSQKLGLIYHNPGEGTALFAVTRSMP